MSKETITKYKDIKIMPYQKKDGKTYYKFQISLGFDPFKNKHVNTTKSGFESIKDAKQAINKMLVERETKEIHHLKTYTFKQVYEMWLSQHKQEIKPTTLESKESKFNAKILPKFGHLNITDITSFYCQEVINGWANEMSAFNDYKIQTNLVFKFAIMHGIIEMNPFDKVVTPKKRNTLVFDEDEEEAINFYTKKELQLFLELLFKERPFKYYLMYRILAFTGLRKGELLALYWSDIDFSQKTLRVRKTLAEPKGGRILQTPKSIASRRIISLDEQTLSFLATWKEEQVKEYATFSQNIETDVKQLIFSRYYPKNKEFDFLRLAHLNDKLFHFLIHHPELPNITVHALRHTHASLLFEAGVTIKDVQARLGHSDIKTTMDIYTHVTNSAKERAAKAFEDFMKF
ncbi:tyrosine-type recombinase/integrase [Lysinibacillus sphaericus]|uniref:tyrosine-type recombinase/integrase n=1 Tax=Lysinibacillus sphaericus TaxID=1421 RepID=UPI0018CF0A0E|nr:site-specific integrase [Lysinibacillus sphaericus]